MSELASESTNTSAKRLRATEGAAARETANAQTTRARGGLPKDLA